MRVLLVIHILLSLWKKFNYIADTNTFKTEAESAYKTENYRKAISAYINLTKEYQLSDEDLKLNLAHCYFRLNDTANAKIQYTELIAANNFKIRSISNQQLGILAANNGQLKESITFFKQAIIADPANDVARFNYELIKKYNDSQSSIRTNRSTPLLLKSRKSNKNNLNGSGDSPGDNREEHNNNTQSEKGKQQDDNKQKQELENAPEGTNEISNFTTQKRLHEMNLSQEKARKLLEAMRREEVQYLQQKQKKISTPEGKPDW